MNLTTCVIQLGFFLTKLGEKGNDEIQKCTFLIPDPFSQNIYFRGGNILLPSIYKMHLVFLVVADICNIHVFDEVFFALGN